MLLPHRIQKAAFLVFAIGMVGSFVYIVLILTGVSMPGNIKGYLPLVLGALVYLSALVAPFTREKEENEVVEQVRLKTIALVTAFYFCIILTAYAIRVLLLANSVESTSWIDEVLSSKSIVLFEIIYFVILKVSISRIKVR